jgi:hypothetical protein
MAAFARSSVRPAATESVEPDAVIIEVEIEEPRADAQLPGIIEPQPILAIEGAPGPVIVEQTIENPEVVMHQALARGDYDDAIGLAELILSGDPGNENARACALASRARLETVFTTRLKSPQAVFVLSPSCPEADVSDPRAARILSLVDGRANLEAILARCDMARLEALRILDGLVREGMVTLA